MKPHRAASYFEEKKTKKKVIRLLLRKIKIFVGIKLPKTRVAFLFFLLQLWVGERSCNQRVVQVAEAPQAKNVTRRPRKQQTPSGF